ncbi:MAG TPA: hypothetical protein VL381_02615 [Rhodocyclaceae bacterium]|nr:hypothetical protein [Rhodocyclaceae bacterium]
MRRTLLKASHILTFVVTGAFISTPVFADKPSWAGGGKGGEEHGGGHGKSDKHGKSDRYEHGDDRAPVVVNINGYFNDQQRGAVRSYYGNQGRDGHCPPGLAKKNNGCLPPGQAKKWAMGRPLPSGVTYYPVPSAVVVQLGAPPAGHKYVRVAGDILLIAVGTSMVVDAIQDLGGL